MKRLLLSLWLLFIPTIAFAQCNGIFQPNTICGNATGQPAVPKQTPNSVLTGVPGGTNGQIQYNNNGAFGGTGPVTCLNGQFVNAVAAPFVCGTPNGTITGSSTVTGAATTYTSAQGNIVVKRSNTGSPMSDILPGTSPGILPANTVIYITNSDSAGILSIKAGSGASIKTTMAATGYVYICPGQTISFYSDGVNYYQLGSLPSCILTAATTIFVSATGSNTNDGLTALTPLADIQAAWNLAQQSFYINQQTLTIKLADGTYAKTLFLAGTLPGQGLGDYTQSQPSSDTSILIVGNTTTPDNVVVSGGSQSGPVSFGIFNIYQGARIAVEGMKLTSSTNQYGFYVIQGWLSFQNIDFGTISGPGSKIHINIGTGGNVEAYTPYSISGGAGCHIIAAQGGAFQFLGGAALAPGTITLTGTPAFTSGFACVQQNGTISVSVVDTFSGTATGPKYNGSFNGTINAAGQGINYFPGNSAGALSTGAQYN